MLETEKYVNFAFTAGSSNRNRQSLLEVQTQVGILEWETEVETD